MLLKNKPTSNIIETVDGRTAACKCQQRGADRMNWEKVAFVCGLVAFSAALGGLSAYGRFPQQDTQTRPVPKVTRAKRPIFTERDKDGIFFDNVFDEALVGNRPAAGAAETPAGPAFGQPPASGGGGAEGFAWSQYIGSDVLETEIKRLQRKVSQEVTSPTKYKTEYKKARYSFNMLAIMFGIILEHDDENVRWKRVASVAHPSFVVAAKNARRPDQDSYNYAVGRRDDLQELVRGGNMSSNEKPVESFEWGDAVGRNAIMQRLQECVDNSKPILSNKEGFAENPDELLLEATIVAALAQILVDETMEDGDDEDYAAHSIAMSNGALEIVSALQTGNYAGAEAGLNKINQSCSNCHDEYR